MTITRRSSSKRTTLRSCTATIGADGTLGEWRTMSKLDKPVATQSALAASGHVWIFGGMMDDTTDQILRAPIGKDGTLGTWAVASSPLPLKRAHVHQTPEWHGFVYLTNQTLGRAMREPQPDGDCHHEDDDGDRDDR